MGRKKDPDKVTQRDRRNTTTLDVDKPLKVRIQLLTVELGIPLREAVAEALEQYERVLRRRVEQKRRREAKS